MLCYDNQDCSGGNILEGNMFGICLQRDEEGGERERGLYGQAESFGIFGLLYVQSSDCIH